MSSFEQLGPALYQKFGTKKTFTHLLNTVFNTTKQSCINTLHKDTSLLKAAVKTEHKTFMGSYSRDLNKQCFLGNFC